MLKSQRMIKVGIVCPHHLLEGVVKRLYSLKVLQIEEHDKNDEFDIGHPMKQAEEVSGSIIKLKSIASHIQLNLKEEFKRKDIIVEEIHSEIKSIHEEIRKKVEKIDFYTKALPIIRNDSHQKQLGQIKISSQRANDSESILFCGLIKKDIDKEIKQLSPTAEIATRDADGAKLSLLLMPKSKKEETLKILNENLFISLKKEDIKEAFPQIKTPIYNMEKTPKDLEKELREEKKSLDHALSEIKKTKKEFLLNANKTLLSEIEKCEAPTKFASSKYVNIISGWVPEKNFEHLKQTLEKETDNKVFIHRIDLKENEKAPILLKNPKPAGPFQFFLDMFTLPGYHEFDPTLLMFITFPLFFGFMLGDIGYGLTTLIIFGLMRLKFKKGVMKSLLDIMIIASIGTIIFGFLFGEFFGEEVIFGHELWHILSRAHEFMELLSIAVLIGIFHVLLGLILGFINVAKHHGLKHAIEEKFGWMLLIPGALMLLVEINIIGGEIGETILHILPNAYILGGLAVIGAILITIGEGVKGAIELPAIFSNVLSYARLMAVGLASVELALIINEIAKELIHEGGVLMIIFAILLLIIGHAINLALGLIGPFLHSLRLHYVEFFGKFYEGGGKRFVPFGEKE